VTSDHFVILGNGAAGFRAAKALRRADIGAQISLFTQEPHPFYLRRQLGDFLAGNLTLSELIFQGRNAYRRERIDLFLATRIVRVAPAAHEVVFASGQRVRYDRLLVATGTEAVPLDLPGADLAGVVRFDTLHGAVEVREALKDVRRAVILDAGLVGLTLAQSLAGCGIAVTQLVDGPSYWPEMLDEKASHITEKLMEENGIAVRRHTAARAIIGAGGRAIGVETAGGDILGAELVAYGSRRRPAVALVEGSAIAVGRGIRVDQRLRTTQPDVFAAGDVAEPVPSATETDDRQPAPPGDTPFCWQRAWNHGAIAAANMLEPAGLEAAPAVAAGAIRMRTEVFGHELAILGAGHLPDGPDTESVLLPAAGGSPQATRRGDPETYQRLVFRGGRLVGATVFAAGERVPELDRLVASGADRAAVERAIGPAEPQTAGGIPQTFARHCPICSAELVVHHGTPPGRRFRCEACNTELVVRWDSERMWIEVSRP
jgi:NADPH-dependent 2,4-dienoyl-CoA reductase/sulfur reductase-like enzyme